LPLTTASRGSSVRDSPRYTNTVYPFPSQRTATPETEMEIVPTPDRDGIYIRVPRQILERALIYNMAEERGLIKGSPRPRSRLLRTTPRRLFPTPDKPLNFDDTLEEEKQGFDDQDSQLVNPVKPQDGNSSLYSDVASFNLPKPASNIRKRPKNIPRGITASLRDSHPNWESGIYDIENQVPSQFEQNYGPKRLPEAPPPRGLILHGPNRLSIRPNVSRRDQRRNSPMAEKTPDFKVFSDI